MRQEWDYPPGRTQRLIEPTGVFIDQPSKPPEPLSWRHKKVKAAVNFYFWSIILVLKIMASVVLVALLYVCYQVLKGLLSL
jgi:hypothetical protein